MTSRQVTSTGKSGVGNITKLCGTFGEVSKAQAIDDINSRRHSYYVSVAGRRVNVLVFGGVHLRTNPNGRVPDNLDNLPDC